MKKTKKITLLIAVLILMAVCFAFGVSASNNYDEADYRYSVSEGRACINDAKLDSEGTFFVPAELDGYPVDSVGFSTSIICKAFEVDEENQFLSNDEYGVLFNKEKTVLLRFPSDQYVEEYYVPSSVVELGKMAFTNGGTIEKLYIHKNITKIHDSANLNTFELGNNICEFIVDSENPNFTSIDGVLYSKNCKRLIAVPGGKDYEEFVVPNFVEEIAYHGSTLLKIGTLRFEEDCKIKNFHGGSFSFSSIDKLIIPNSLKLENIALGDAKFKEIIFEEGRENEILNTWYYDYGYLGSIVLPTSISVIKEGSIANFAYVTILNPFCELENNFIDDKYYYNQCMIIGYEKSTAHNYAKQHNMPFQALECKHGYGFGKWINNFNNMTATRECVTCYYTESKVIEKTEIGDVQIFEPVNPNSDYEVDVIVRDSEKYIIIDESLKNSLNGEYEIVKAFDITLKNKDGVHIQPDGTVKVKLPNDWSKKGIYRVYRVNEDGTLTDMSAYREGSHMVFDTDHFSIYVLVYEGPDIANCNCICHKTGFFYEVLNILVRFAMKFLGIITTCECGAAHY